MAEQLLSLLRRRDQSAVALQQANAEKVLQLRDPHRDRRLGRMQLFGGAAKAAQIGDPHEGLNRLEIDHRCLRDEADKISLSNSIRKHDWTRSRDDGRWGP